MRRSNNPCAACCLHAAFAAAVQHDVGQCQVHIGGNEVVLFHSSGRPAGDGAAGPAAAPVGVLAVIASGGGQDNRPAFTGGSVDSVRRRVVFHQHFYLVGAAGIKGTIGIVQLRFRVSQEAERAG